MCNVFVIFHVRLYVLILYWNYSSCDFDHNLLTANLSFILTLTLIAIPGYLLATATPDELVSILSLEPILPPDWLEPLWEAEPKWDEDTDWLVPKRGEARWEEPKRDGPDDRLGSDGGTGPELTNLGSWASTSRRMLWTMEMTSCADLLIEAWRSATFSL